MSIFPPSVSDVLFVGVFASLALASGKRLLGDSSTGFHIRAGELMWESMSILRHDVFSFRFPPLPWTAHEWLAEVIMALIHRGFGLTGVVVFFAFLIALTYYVLFRMAVKGRKNIILGVMVVVLVMVSSQIHWLARPHAFSFVLTAIWYAILDEYQTGQRNRLFWLPAIMLLWVNLHGGFMLGFMLLGLYLACNVAGIIFGTASATQESLPKAKRLALVVLACLASALINPAGYEILLFPFRLVGDQFLMDNIMEYASPDFHGTVPFRYLLYLTIAIFGISTMPVTLVELGLILLLTHMALYGVRYIPLFGIIAAPILVRHGHFILERAKGKWIDAFKALAEKIAVSNALSRPHLWAACGGIGVILYAAAAQVNYQFDPEKKPVAAVEFLKKTNLRGNMFNSDAFGDYLIYATWPQYRVFVDGRQDMYGPELLREYDAVIRVAPGWDKIVEKYRIEWIFFDADSALSVHLSRDPDWHLIFADKVANIFVRKNSVNQNLIEKFPGTKAPANQEPTT
ncbi:MAG: hypothetical protein ACREQW_04190 [Candidatus Binatia bacterium]